MDQTTPQQPTPAPTPPPQTPAPVAPQTPPPAAPQQTPPQSTTPTPASQPEKPKSLRWIWVAIIAAVALIGFGVWYYFFY